MNQTKLKKFNKLVAIEPRLGELLSKAKAIKAGGADNNNYSVNIEWYGFAGHGGLKREFIRLVGFGAENLDPHLANSDAYDIAFQVIFEALGGRT